MNTTNYVTKILLTLATTLGAWNASAVCSANANGELFAESKALINKLTDLEKQDVSASENGKFIKAAYHPETATALDHKFHKIDTTLPYFQDLSGVGVLTNTAYKNSLSNLKGYGSATLIGSCYILTNRHVVETSFNGAVTAPKKGQKFFYSAGKNSNCNSKDHFLVQDQEAQVVTFGNPNSEGYGVAQDWALLKLSKPVTDKVRKVKIEDTPSISKGMLMLESGFPADEILASADPENQFSQLHSEIVKIEHRKLTGTAVTSDSKVHHGISGGAATYNVYSNGYPTPYLGGINAGNRGEGAPTEIIATTRIREDLKSQGFSEQDWKKITEEHNRESCD